MKRLGIAAALVLLTAVGHASPSAPVAPAGLAAEWRFSEGSGTTAADSAGGGFTGTLTNGPVWTSGRVGGGLSFDGVNDYVNLGTNVNLLSGVSAATVSLWIKPGSTSPAGSFRELVSISVASATATNTSRVALSLQGDGTGGDLYAGARSTDTEAQKILSSDTNFTVGTWVHVAGVYDFAGNSIKLYVNGALVATNAAAGFAAAATPSTASRSLALGAQDMGDSNFFHGVMDEVRVYRRALSAAELQTLAQADALQARWSLDEGAGSAAGDSSDSGLTGTLRNSPSWSTGILGSALHFDGVSQYVDLGSNLSVLRNTNAATISAWVRPGSTLAAGAFRDLVSLSVNSGSPTDTSRLVLSLQGDGTGGDVFFGARSTDTEAQKTLLADTNLVPNTWVHVAGVVDYVQGTLSIFLNGNLVKTGPAAFTQSHTPNAVSTNGALGAQDKGDGNFFQGDLDEVRVYGRGLAACEISDLALKDGLHLNLTMNEASGTTTADASGHGTVGTLKNGAVFAPGQFGNGISLDGVNDYVDLGTGLDALTSAHGATLAAWVKMTSVPASGAFYDLISISVNSPGGPTDTSRAVLSLVGDGTAADLFAGGRSTDAEAQQTATGNANIAAGVWTHVAATIDFAHNAISVYKNGVLVLTQAVTFSQVLTPATLSTSSAIGSQDKGDGNFFRGTMDEVRVYCRSLSGSEIAALAAPGLPAAPNLTAANPGNGRVDLTWTAVAGASSYNVKRALSPGGPFTTIANVATTSYPDLSVTNGTPYIYKITALNLAGEGPDSNTRTATPTVPSTLPAPVIVSPTGPVNTSTPGITGTSSAPGLTITVFVDGTANGTTTSVVAGNWFYAPPTALTQGSHALTAQASIGTQTSAMSASVSINVDTQAPSISVVSPLDGATLFTATPVIAASWSDSGTGIVAGTAAVTVDGSLVASPNATTSGFSFTSAPLADGPHTVSATIQDAASNATTVSWSFSLLHAPPSPSISLPAGGSLLRNALPPVTGSSSAGGLTITLQVDGNPRGTTTSGAGGAWSLVPSTPLADGPHTLTASAANAAGTSPLSGGVSVVVDTVAPSIGNPVPGNGTTVFSSAVTLSASWSDVGTGIVPGTAVLTLDGQPVGATPNGTGFSFPATLTAGLHTVTGQVNDAAGNTGSITWSFSILLPPAPPSIASPSAGAILPSSQPSVSGSSASGGLTITLYVDGVSNSSAPSQADGSWTLVASPALSEGSHTLTARAANAAGSSGPSSPIAITIQTASTPIDLSNPSIAPGGFVNSSQPDFSGTLVNPSGTGINAASVVVRLDGNQIAATIAAVDANHVTVSFSTPTVLGPGAHVIRIDGQTTGGAPIATVVDSFVVDQSAPVISNVQPAPGSLNGSAMATAAATITDQGGSGVDPDSVFVVLNGVQIPAPFNPTSSTSGTFDFGLPPFTSDGTQVMTVQARDRAGNAAADVTTQFVTDGFPPQVTVNSPADGQSYSSTSIPVDVWVVDAGAGVNPSAFQITLGSDNVTSSLVIASGPLNAFGYPNTVHVTGTINAADGSNNFAVTAVDGMSNSQAAISLFTAQASADTTVGIPPVTVDITADSVQSPPLETSLPDPPEYWAPSSRFIQVKVRVTAGGVPLEGVEIDPTITSGKGNFFYDETYRPISDSSGMAGFIYQCPKRPGMNDVVVKAKYLNTGQQPVYHFKALEVLPHVDMGSDFPGAGTRAFITVYPGVGRTSIHLQEVDAQGNEVTDPAQKKFTLYQRVYTTEDNSNLHVPLAINSNATGVGYLKATATEFEDSSGNQASDTGFSNINYYLTTDFDSRGMLVSGGGQVAVPNQPLEQLIIVKPVIFHHVPNSTYKVIQAYLLEPGDMTGKIEAVDGVTIVQNQNRTAFEAIVVRPDDTLAIRYTAGPLGKSANIHILGFEAGNSELDLPPETHLTPDTPDQPVTPLPPVATLGGSSTPAEPPWVATVGDGVPIQQANYNFIWRDNGDKDISVVPTQPVDILVDTSLYATWVDTTQRVFYLQATTGDQADFTVDLVAVGVDDVNDKGRTALWPPMKTTITMEKQTDPPDAQGRHVFLSKKPLLATSGRRTPLGATPIDYYFDLFRIGEYVQIQRNGTMVAEYPSALRVVTVGSTQSGLPIGIPRPGPMDFRVNGGINVVRSVADSFTVKVTVRPGPTPNAASQAILMCKMDPPTPALGTFNAGGLTLAQLPVLIQKDGQQVITFNYNAPPPNPALPVETTLVLTMSYPDKRFPESEVRIPVRISAPAAFNDIQYIFLTAATNSDMQNRVDSRIEQIHNGWTQPIWEQAGVFVTKPLGAPIARVWNTQPANMLNVNKNDAPTMQAFQQQAGRLQLATPLVVFVVDGFTTGEAGFTDQTRQFPTRRWVLVTKSSLGMNTQGAYVDQEADYSTAAHELAHAVVLDHVRRINGTTELYKNRLNLMWTKDPMPDGATPKEPTGNALVFKVDEVLWNQTANTVSYRLDINQILQGRTIMGRLR